MLLWDGILVYKDFYIMIYHKEMIKFIYKYIRSNKMNNFGFIVNKVEADLTQKRIKNKKNQGKIKETKKVNIKKIKKENIVHLTLILRLASIFIILFKRSRSR